MFLNLSILSSYILLPISFDIIPNSEYVLM